MAFSRRLTLTALLLPAWLPAGALAEEAAAPVGLNPAAGVVAAELAQPAVDPKADALLRKMAEFLAKQQQFRVHAVRSLDLVLDDGRKVQADSAADLSVRRPDGLRVSRKGVDFDQDIYFDGKAFTVARSTGFYATMAAPATIDAMLDRAIDELQVVPPGADLLYSDAYKVLTEDVVSGDYVGLAMIDATRCHHLSFRNHVVDWEIWVADGDRPLPCKLAVTQADAEMAPQFVAYYSAWDLDPKLAADAFTFNPPATAVRISFAGADAPQTR